MHWFNSLEAVQNILAFKRSQRMSLRGIGARMASEITALDRAIGAALTTTTESIALFFISLPLIQS